MRWQRSITALLNRWSDQVDPFGHELRELGPYVHPVVTVGADVVDAERPTYFAYPFSPAVVGDVSGVALEAGSLTVELLSCVVTLGVADRIGLITNQDTGTVFTGNIIQPDALLVEDERNAPLSLRETRGGSGTRLLRGTAAWGAGAGLQAAAFLAYELVNRGPVFLPPGQRVAVALQNPNIGVSAAFAWRELAA